MTINIQNTFDAPALAALAGNRAPSLNLPLHGVDVGAYGRNLATGIWQGRDLQQRYQQMNNQMDIAKLQTGTQYNTAMARINADIGLKQYEVTNTNQQNELNRLNQQNISENRNAVLSQRNQVLDNYNQGRLAIDAQNSNLNAQNTQSLQNYRQGQLAQGQQHNDIEKAKLDMADKVNQTNEQLRQRTAMASMMYNMAQDPKYATNPALLIQDQNKNADTLLKNGMISQDEHDKFTNISDPNQRQALLQYEVTSGSLAKGLMGSPQALALLKGQTTQPANQATQTKLQNTVIQSQNFVKQLDNITQMMKPEYFSYSGMANEKAGQVLAKTPGWVQSTANIVGSPFGFNSQQASQQAAQKSAFQNQVGTAAIQSMNSMLGSVRANPKTMAMMKTLLPDPEVDSYQMAQAKLQQLNRTAQDIHNTMSNGLKLGIPIDKLGNQIDNVVDNRIEQYNSALNQVVPKSITYQGKMYNQDQLKAIAEHNNMSIDQVVHTMQNS